MRFAVLGPLEVHDGDRPVPIGGAKPKALLALLLLERGGVVSADRLVDALWGEAPPPTAAKAVQVHVRTLRRQLGDAAIRTVAPGYALPVGEDGLDLARFAALVAQARRATDPAVAERRLADALALWRGPAFADLAYETFVQAETVRLEELRVAATEDLMEARLAQGRHAELTAELEALVARHPLRERLRAQLMVALYRSGRQADALDAFRAGSRVLREELGLAPGPALREVERRILEQDPALGAPDAPVPAPVDERRLVTLLAVACEPDDPRADPEETSDLLEAAARLAAAAIEAAGGRIHGTGAGEVLLATFAADRALQDHAAQACTAAEDAARSITARCESALTIRTAIETGSVVVREGGARVSGGPVPAVLRLVAAADPGVVAVGPRAAALLERWRAPTTFVGRAGELAILGSVLERVHRGGAHRAVVAGDAGVGKTSLVRRFGELLPEDTAVRTAGCSQIGGAAPFQPLAPLVREALGLSDGAPEDAVRRAAGRRAGLELLLGLEPGEDLHPLDARDRVRKEWIGILDEYCVEAPLVLVVEDVHWAAEPLLDLLEVTAAQAAGPLLLLTTTRPEGSPGVAPGGRVTQIWLEPLPPADADRLLEAVAPGLPEPVARAVLERAEGNPFFLEEGVAAFHESGDVDRTSDSVQSVIGGRIALLPPRERQALQAAAVIGHAFWERAVRALVADETVGLALLEQRDFVRRVRHRVVLDERHFSFKHALIRDVAYESLPHAARAKLHGRFAGWLEQEGGGRDEHAPLLAHHYAAAASQLQELRPQAVQWLRRAADLAVNAYDVDVALELLHRALTLAARPKDRIELWLAAGLACRIRFDTHGFRTAVEQALELGPDRETEAAVYGELAYAGSQPQVWTEPPGEDVVAGWIDRALALADPVSSARGNALVASATGHPDGLRHVGEATEIGQELGDTLLLTRAAQMESELLILAGRLHEACECSLRHVEETASRLDPFQLEGRLFQSGFAFMRAGRFEEARPLVERHHEVACRLSPHHEVHAVAMDLLIEVLQQRWSAASPLAGRALEAAHANATTPCQFNWRALMYAALASASAGRADLSAELEAAAREQPEVGGTPATEGAYLRLCLLRGDLAELERLLVARPEINRWGDVGFDAARMDGLAALGARAAVEAEAPRLIEMDGYDAPFALRALAVVREDEALLRRAAAGFSRLGLPLPDAASVLYRPA